MLGCVEGVKSVLQQRKLRYNAREVDLLFYKIHHRYSADKVLIIVYHRCKLQNLASLQSFGKQQVSRHSIFIVDKI